MLIALGVERFADRADAAVHHVRWRLDVGAGLGLHDGLLDQRLDRFVVQDLAVADDAVVTVAVEGVKGDVCHDADVGHGLLDGRGRAANEVAWVVGLARIGRLRLGIGLGEDRDGGDAEIACFLGSLDEKIDRETVNARHRLDRRARLAALLDEHRPDQVVYRELVLGDQAT